MLEIWGGENVLEVGEKVFVVWSCIGVEMLECWGVGALELQDNMCGCYWRFMVVEVMEIELHSCGGTGETFLRVNPDEIRVQHDAFRAMQLEIRGMTLGTNRVL